VRDLRDLGLVLLALRGDPGDKVAKLARGAVRPLTMLPDCTRIPTACIWNSAIYRRFDSSGAYETTKADQALKSNVVELTILPETSFSH
jgi:hypothetical protein